MINISNPELRPKDVRKVVNNLSQSIIWDQGCDSNNEWVFASLESPSHVSKLMEWLNSKNIPTFTDVVVTNSSWHNIQQTKWSNILIDLSSYFSKENLSIYDANLKWLIDYKTQEIARFGRFAGNKNV